MTKGLPSPLTVIMVTVATAKMGKNCRGSMPILVVAAVALAAFGAIGILLAAAVIVEQRSKQKQARGI